MARGEKHDSQRKQPALCHPPDDQPGPELLLQAKDQPKRQQHHGAGGGIAQFLAVQMIREAADQDRAQGDTSLHGHHQQRREMHGKSA